MSWRNLSYSLHTDLWETRSMFLGASLALPSSYSVSRPNIRQKRAGGDRYGRLEAIGCGETVAWGRFGFMEEQNGGCSGEEAVVEGWEFCMPLGLGPLRDRWVFSSCLWLVFFISVLSKHLPFWLASGSKLTRWGWWLWPLWIWEWLPAHPLLLLEFCHRRL